MKSLLLFSLFSSFPLFAALLPPQRIAELVEKAIEAQKTSYSPYSKYRVGSALLTKSGKIFLGCNIENASYGLGNCSERTAVFKAISEGEREFEAIAIVTRDGGMSCGACRQVLNEFNPKLIVITADETGKVHHEKTLDELLPHAFGPSNLD